MVLLSFLLTVLLALACGTGKAQPHRGTAFFQHLTVDDGLPENSVRAMLQDDKGFLWFGTQAGLVRYDGYEMDSGWRAASDSIRIPNLVVTALCEDDSGRIWVGSLTRGLWRVDPRRRRIERVSCGTDSVANSRRFVAGVSALSGSADGSIWVSWNALGLCRHFPGGACIEEMRHDPGRPGSIPSDSLNTVYEDSGGGLWVGAEGRGLAMRSPGSDRFHRFTASAPGSGGIPSDRVNSVFEGSDGRIWITTFDGLCTWSPRTQEFHTYRPDPDHRMRLSNYLLDMDSSPDGGLWVGSAVGLYYFDPVSGDFELYAHDADDPRSPVKGPVLSVVRDRSGIVWAGSWRAGLNKMDPRWGHFGVLKANPEEPGTLDDDAVMAILEDRRGVLWVGTGSMSSGGSQGGLNLRRPGRAGFEQIPLPRTGPDVVRGVQSLCEDDQGNLWFGTDRGLWRLTTDGLVAERMYAVSDAGGDAIADRGVRHLMMDRDGWLWASVWGQGLFRIDPRTGQRRHYAHDPADPHSVQQNELVFVVQDSRGTLWVGGDTRGLSRYRPGSDDFEAIPGSALSIGSVASMLESSDGELWLGTMGGLIRLDESGHPVGEITRDDGLPHNVIGAILEDDEGMIWLSTERGIARVDPRTRSIRTYDTRDGLPANEISFKGFEGADGTLWFGGNHGLIYFRPETLSENTFTPPLVFTSLQTGDVLQRPGEEGPLNVDLPYTSRVELDHRQNDLTISFAALDYAHPERNRFRYRLLNDDDAWREAGTRHMATYTNLEPGTYRFEVEGSNSDARFNGAVAGLEIYIAPPWWQTPLARVLYLILVALAVWLIYRQVVQRERMTAALVVQRAKTEQLQELDSFKSRFFANVSHEFRTPLTLIQAPLQRLAEESDGAERTIFEMMSRNAHRLGELIDQLLDLSRLESRRLPLRWQYGDCVAYMRSMLHSFESLAHSRNVDFDVEIREQSCKAWYDPDVLQKLVSNLLSNAFRHTPDGGQVVVEVGTLDNAAPASFPGSPYGPGEVGQEAASTRSLWVEVRNSGSYIPPPELDRIFDRFHQLGNRSAGGSGIGLALVKELVDWMHGTVSVRSDRGEGTCFRFEVPLFLQAPMLGLEPMVEEDVLQEPEVRERKFESAADAGGADRPAAVAHAPAAGVEAPLVLVVEDHAELRSFISDELLGEYRVISAEDGQVGLEQALAEMPDLVLSDVMMPNLDGVQMCARLKQDERTSHIPVILLTARVETEDRRAGLEVGADDYLPKPFDPQELRIRVRNLIEQRRRLAQKYAGRVINLAPDAMPVTSADERFLARVRRVAEEHLDDPQLNVDTLCREVALSRAQLHRKLKALTGYSTKEFVRIHRLQRAATLLKGRYGNVTEVAYAVGFQSLSYFSRAFREQYGESPSDYLEKYGRSN